jgi:hypothetical protein
MKARETVGKLVSMFGKPQPVGNFHFSTKDSSNRPEGEPPLYYGILRTVFNPRKNFKGFKSAWVYWIATFDPNNIDGTAINTTVPYLDEEKAIRAYKDVFDRYYPEANDIEYGCKDWSALGENKKGTVTLGESQLRKLVAESVKKVLKEYRPNTKKDPMGQWFKDMDDAQKVRDTMNYIYKGGKNPVKKKSEDESEKEVLKEWTPQDDDYAVMKGQPGAAGIWANAYKEKYIDGQEDGTPEEKSNESQLREMIAQSVKKVLKEMETPTPYGPMTSGEWKPTFDDPKQQEEFSSDVIDMLSKIPDERFVNLYWNRRLTFDDPNTVDAIYKEAIKRGLFDNPAL